MFPKIFPALAASLLLGAGTPPPAPDADPRALMIQARALQPDGGGNNPQGAAALYRKVIALVPDSSQAYLRLSEALMQSGNLAAALDPAEKATELDPRSGEAWAHLGLLYYVQSQSRESQRPVAKAALAHAVKLLPTDAELWTRLAETEDSLRDNAGALEAWLSVGRLHPTATYQGRVLADYAWERAMELAIQLKNYEARREAVLALCDRTYPDQRYLKYLEELARDQVDLGFLGHAEESFRILGQFLPQEPAIWENVGIIQLNTDRFDDALRTFARAESLQPSARTSFNMGLCLMKLGNFPEAEARWKSLLPALEKSSEEPSLLAPARELYGTAVLLSGRPRELLDLSGSWPDLASQPQVLALRAQAFIQVQDWKQARAALRDGMARFPRRALFRRAAMLGPKVLDDGRLFQSDAKHALTGLDLEATAELWAEFRAWDRCLEAAQKARKEGPPPDVDLLLLQANALQNLGRPDQAIQVLREGQKLDPRHPVLQNNLGFSLLERGGNLDEAAHLIKSALDQDPSNSSTMDSWGWVLFKQGKTEEAEAALRKASEMAPYSPEIHQHLGEALLKLDRPQDALDEWERALAFVFPDRKALEDQVQSLRTRLARDRALKAAGEDTAAPASDDGPDDNDDEEGNP